MDAASHRDSSMTLRAWQWHLTPHHLYCAQTHGSISTAPKRFTVVARPRVLFTQQRSLDNPPAGLRRRDREQSLVGTRRVKTVSLFDSSPDDRSFYRLSVCACA